jgi:hypothetical protein
MDSCLRRNDGGYVDDDEGAGMTCPRVILANAGIHPPPPAERACGIVPPKTPYPWRPVNLGL